MIRKSRNLKQYLQRLNGLFNILQTTIAEFIFQKKNVKNLDFQREVSSEDTFYLMGAKLTSPNLKAK